MEQHALQNLNVNLAVTNPISNRQCRRAVRVDNKVYQTSGEEPNEIALSEGLQIIFLQLEELQQGEFPTNSHYSPLPPDRIVSALLEIK